jgi:hypothetical protein
LAEQIAKIFIEVGRLVDNYNEISQIRGTNQSNCELHVEVLLEITTKSTANPLPQSCFKPHFTPIKLIGFS